MVPGGVTVASEGVRVKLGVVWMVLNVLEGVKIRLSDAMWCRIESRAVRGVPDCVG